MVFPEKRGFKKIIVLYIIIYAVVFIPHANAVVYEDGLIDNYLGLYGPFLEFHEVQDYMYVSGGENVIVCPLIHWKNICGTLDSTHVTYELKQGSTTEERNMTRIYDTNFIKSLHLNSNDLRNKDMWCFEASIPETSELTIHAYCGDYGTPEIEDYKEIKIYAGDVYLRKSNLIEGYNNMDFGFYPGENLSFAIYAEINGQSIGTKDVVLNHKYYSLLDPTDASLYSSNPRNVESNESVWLEKREINKDTAIGIVSFKAIYDSHYGGTYLIYKSKPFKNNIIVSDLSGNKIYSKEDYISTNEEILINASGLNTLYYGNYTNIKATIETPEGEKNLNISIGDYISNYTIAEGEGIYNITIEVTHSSGYKETINRSLNIRNDYISITGILDEYVPGDLIIATYTAYKSDGTPLNTIMNFSLIDSEGNEILKLDDKDAIVNGPTHLLSFKLPSDLELGKYNITISAKNGTKIINTYKEIELKSMEYYTNYTIEPTKWDLEPTLGLTMQKKEFIIKNTGGRKINTSAINISVSDNYDKYFIVDRSNMPDTLSFNESATFFITFRPQDDIQEGTYNRTITIDIYGKKKTIDTSLNISLESKFYIPSPVDIDINGDKQNIINISVKNTGDKKIDKVEITNLNKSKEIEFYKSYIIPTDIGHSEEKNITFYIDRFKKSGTYTISFFVEKGDYSREIKVNLNVYTGLSEKIISVQNSIDKFKSDLEELNQRNIDTTSLESKIDELSRKLEDAKDELNQTKYEEVSNTLKELESEIQQTAKRINELYSDSQSKQQQESYTEENTETKKSNNTVTIIMLFVFLVVLGVIIYSSIVPDDY